MWRNHDMGSSSDSWLIPSLVKTRGTRLAPLPNSPLPGADGILYLGSPDLLLYELRPAALFLDDTLVAELHRQAAFIPWPSAPSPPIDDYIDLRRVRERDVNPLCATQTTERA